MCVCVALSFLALLSLCSPLLWLLCVKVAPLGNIQLVAVSAVCICVCVGLVGADDQKGGEVANPQSGSLNPVKNCQTVGITTG